MRIKIGIPVPIYWRNDAPGSIDMHPLSTEDKLVRHLINVCYKTEKLHAREITYQFCLTRQKWKHNE
jgi:hypothetical protein